MWTARDASAGIRPVWKVLTKGRDLPLTAEGQEAEYQQTSVKYPEVAWEASASWRPQVIGWPALADQPLFSKASIVRGVIAVDQSAAGEPAQHPHPHAHLLDDRGDGLRCRCRHTLEAHILRTLEVSSNRLNTPR